MSQHNKKRDNDLLGAVITVMVVAILAGIFWNPLAGAVMLIGGVLAILAMHAGG